MGHGAQRMPTGGKSPPSIKAARKTERLPVARATFLWGPIPLSKTVQFGARGVASLVTHQCGIYLFIVIS